MKLLKHLLLVLGLATVSTAAIAAAAPSSPSSGGDASCPCHCPLCPHHAK